MLTHSAIAVFAGALGCVVTLFAVGASSEPVSEHKLNAAAKLESPLAVDTLTELPETGAEWQELQIAIAEGVAERSQMAKTLVQLARDLTDVQAQLQTLEQANFERQALAQASLDAQASVSQETTDAAQRVNRRNQGLTGQERVQSLVAAGIDEQTALQLQARRDQQQLARLELLDQAAREGWSESDELQQRLAELDAGRVDLREELGDDAFDRFLYESGDANRVGIASIISGSAADIAGLEVGDAILSYDNQRIFRVRELQQATREGSKGEYVQILFDRGGQFLSADLPRGPLGVTLETSSVSP